MPACRYEIYLLVFNSISHSFTALTRVTYRVEHLNPRGRKSPSSRLFSTRRTKDFFSDPKNGSLRFNQSEVPWVSLGDRIVKQWATKRDLIAKASKAAGHHVFLSAQFRHKCLSKVNLRHFISPIRRSIQRFKLACVRSLAVFKQSCCVQSRRQAM